jgi:DNA-directed RNA polymerase subunit alpha
VDGVVHEHQTIPGVVEDVHQIIQNLKSLVLVLDDDVEEVTLEVKASKAGPVTAGDIKERGGVEVLEVEHRLLTLQEDRSFRMELRVNKGRGFVPADQHPIEKGAPVDLVRVDSIYNPVRRANFQVLETRVGQRTDFDQLNFYVETDGSISPERALATAGALVRKHLEYLSFFEEGGVPLVPVDGRSPVPAGLQDLFARPIEDLAELSVRSRNSLQKENIRTLGELVQRSEEEMLEIENFGRKSLQEIQDFLAQHNLRFAMRVSAQEDGELYFLDEEDAIEPAEMGDE